MEKSHKIMLLLSALFLLAFIGFLVNDYFQFHKNIEMIIDNLKSSDPNKIKAAWFSLVVIRSAEFLVPAFIFFFAAFYMHYKDNRKPKIPQK